MESSICITQDRIMLLWAHEEYSWWFNINFLSTFSLIHRIFMIDGPEIVSVTIQP